MIGNINFEGAICKYAQPLIPINPWKICGKADNVAFSGNLGRPLPTKTSKILFIYNK